MASSANNSFRTTGFQNDGISTTNTDYFQTSIVAATGFKLSLTSISAYLAGTTTYSATPGASNQFAYSLDGTNFNLIGTPSVRIGSGAIGPIDTSSIGALQNVPAGTTVTVRFYATGQTATGGWGFNSPNATTDGFALSGVVEPASGTAPTISSFSPTIGLAGTSVTINGSNFGVSPTVKFSGVIATSSSVNPAGTIITATVPAGATTGPITVEVVGEVTATSATNFTVGVPPPGITVTPAFISNFFATNGFPSASSNYTVLASNLTGNLVLTTSTNGFEISTNNSDFVQSLELPQSSGNVSNTVYVRVAGAAAVGLVSGSVTNAIAGAGTVLTNSPTLSGSMAPPPVVGHIYWDFNSPTPSSGVPVGWSVDALTRGNNMAVEALLGSNSASSGYTNPFGVPASAVTNVAVGAFGGVLNTATNAYFEVNVVPPDSASAITNISFGTRSTSSGPQAYAIRWSADSFSSDLATGTLVTNSVWAMKVNAPVSIALSNGTNTLRIYGYGGTNVSGTNANWRIDDLTLAVGSLGPSLTASPTNISGLQTFQGSPSPAPYDSYLLSGTAISNSVSIAAPAGLQISFTNDGTGFVDSLFLPVAPPGGTFSTNVFVRIASTAGLGVFTNYITNSTLGGSPRVVTVTGTVSASGPPSITLSPTSATNLVAFVNSPGTAQQITVTGTNLPGVISFAADSAEYEVAAQGGAFGVSVTNFSATGGVALVRIKSGSTAGAVGSAQLVFESGTGLSKVTNSIPLNGTRFTGSTGAEPGLQTFSSNLTFNPTARFEWVLKDNSVDLRGTNFSGVNVGGDLSVNAGAAFDIVLNGANSGTDFANAFWTVNRSWLVFSVTGSTTGSFALGAITPDSKGQYYGDYGSFSLRTDAGRNVYLDWTASGVAVPSISASPTSLTVPQTTVGTNGASTNFIASGSNLSNNITVTADDPVNFAISTNNTVFTDTLTLATNSSGAVTNTTVHVRLKGAGVGNFTNTVSLASSNATTRKVTVTGTVTASNAPTLLPSNNTPLSGFGTTRPNPSSSQSFTLSGTNLATNVTITPPPGWQVSLTGLTNDFANPSVTVPTNPAGIVSNTAVYVRLAGTNAAPTNYVNSVLPLAVAGSLTNNILLSGSVSNLPPAVTVSTNGPLVFSTSTNQVSAVQSFTAGGSNLSNNITVTAPTNFSIAFVNNNADFTNTLTLTNNTGTATNREIFVRLNAIATPTNIAATNISLTTTGASNFVTVSGNVTNTPPSLTATPDSLTNFLAVTGSSSNEVKSFVLAGSNIFTNVTVRAPANFQVALTNTNTAFSNTVSPVATNGVLSTNIYVRVSTNAPTTNNLTGTITNAVSTLTNALVTLQARVAPVPTLGAAPTNLTGFSTVSGVESTNQKFDLSATNLLGLVKLSVTNGYEISLSTNSGFATNLVAASALDNATNYPGGWTNGANGGTGFGPWIINANGGTGFAGVFIGNPTNAGITTNATFGADAFGMYANPGSSGAYANADRTMPALQVGQTFSFQWAINWDSDVGNKGFRLYSGGTSGTEILNVNQAGFPGDLSFAAGGVTNTNIGLAFNTQAMTWSFTMASSNNLLVTSTGRDGTTNIAFTTNITVSAPPDAFRWYVSAMGADDRRQPYFNNLQIAYTGGNITNLPVYVRIGTNAPVTNSLTSRVTISSDYATNAFVNLTGNVASNPVITESNSLVPFVSVQGFPSDPQEFKIGGVNLLTNVLVTPPTGYQVSLDGIAWADNTNVPALPKDGVVTPQQDVFIRVASTAPAGSASGDITLSSTRASNVLIPVSRVVDANIGPQLLATPAALGAFATDLGTSSPSQDFVLTGRGLSNNVALTAPAGFEISTNGTTFVSSAILTPRVSGLISNTIGVRLAGAPPTGILSGNVLAASGTAQASVAVSGTVYQDATANIAATPLSLSGFTTVEGTPSVSQPFLASARQLGSDDLVATASTDYEVSTNDTDFFPSVNVTPVGGSVDPVSFYVRISASATFTASLPGTVTLSSASAASNVIVSLDGKVDPARPLSVTLLSPSNNPTIIAPGSSVRLIATVSDTNSSGNPVQVANFEFRTNNVAIPGAFVTNVISPYTLTYDWTPSSSALPTTVSAWAIDVDGWEGSSASVVVRNPDPGEPVIGFTPPIAYPTNSQIEAVAPATNGAFYLGGSFTNFVRRVGSVSVTNAATRVARILADGAVDSEFVTDTGPNNTVRTVLYSARDKGLYIGGVFTNVSGVSRPALARLTVGQTNIDDGTLDTKFAPALGAVSSPIVNAVVQQYDGKILVGGIFTTAGTNSTSSANLARFNADGARDISFAPPAPNGEVKSIALQPDGKILIAGSFAQVAGQARKGLARLNIDGTLDTTFTVGTGTSGGFNGTVWSVAVALDGSIYAGGQFSSYNGKSVYNNLAKLSATGDLQTKFNFAGTLAGGINNVVRNVQMRPGGDILASGQFTQIANSVLFPTPVAAGRVAEFLPVGTLDATFNPVGTGANNSVLNASTLANGNLVLVGAFTQYNGQSYPRMVVLSGASATSSVITSPSFFTVDAGTSFDFAFTSSGSAPYESISAGLPRGVSFNAAAGTLSGIPLDAGAFDMDVSASNPGGGYGDPSLFRLQVLPKPVPYDTWKKVWFTPAEQTNAAVSGRLVVGQNPSGQPNFTVYALTGGSPKEDGTWILPEAWPEYVEGQQYLAYTVWYYPLAEAFYTVQITGNLQTNWSTNTISITNGPDFFQVRPTVPMSLTNQQFLRLKISAPK